MPHRVYKHRLTTMICHVCGAVDGRRVVQCCTDGRQYIVHSGQSSVQDGWFQRIFYKSFSARHCRNATLRGGRRRATGDGEDRLH